MVLIWALIATSWTTYTAQIIEMDYACFESSNIPIVIIETQGLTILDHPRISAEMKVIDNGPDSRNYVTDTLYTYQGNISIEIRGSSSQFTEKKQYGFETQTPDGQNHNTPLLGLPKENDWILHAPYSDKTLVRNSLAYHISSQLGEYAPRTRACELVLNGEYRGVYILTEKIKHDNNRLDIAEDGGYILKIDKMTGYECEEVLRTDLGSMDLQYDYPDCDEITTEQQSYIDNYINAFEQALYDENFLDYEFGYRAFFETDAFINYFICNELAKNIDAYRSSTFLHKENNSSKLRMGPVWDLNLGFGNVDFLDGHTTSGLIGARTEIIPMYQFKPNPWIERLLEDTVLVEEINARWMDLRSGLLSNDNLVAIVDSLTGELAEAQDRNFQKWTVMGRRVWPNFFVGSSYAEEVGFMKGWLINRANWLDKNITGANLHQPTFEEFEATIFPNPFTYFFTYAFSLKQESSVTLKIISPNGSQPNYILKDSPFPAGDHQLTWNSYINGHLIPSTYYILDLEVNGQVVSREVVVKRL